MDNNEKILFADAVLKLIGDYIEEHADDDLEPREEEYEYAPDKYRTRAIDTTRRERKENLIYNLGYAADQAGLPYITDLIEFAACHSHSLPVEEHNVFEKAIKPKNELDEHYAKLAAYYASQTK